MKKFAISLLIALLAFNVTGCGSSSSSSDNDNESPSASTPAPDDTKNEENDSLMQIKINDEILSVAWEDNESVNALKKLVQAKDLVINMSRYGGFEQVGPLGQSLPRNDVQTTTSAGDIMLYSGNQIVIFYGSNSWRYTRLGKVVDKTADELTELLSQADVIMTLITEK